MSSMLRWAHSHVQLYQHDKAVDDFTHIIALKPDNLDACYNGVSYLSQHYPP